MNKRGWLRGGVLLAGLLLFQLPIQAVAAPAESVPQNPQETIAGDAVRGEALFSGTVFFANGGAPCLACHGASGAGLGMAGGANFAADLTAMYNDYGADGVASILEDLSFPSMEPIYENRPLTAKEQADVAAFLAQVADRPVFAAEGRLYGHVAGGLLALLGVLVLFGWGRLKGVRQPLIDSARKRKGGVR
jgi:mono/diheme cytochrome c family protein